MAKSLTEHFCHFCNYTSSRTYDFKKHCLTEKHLKSEKSFLDTNSEKAVPEQKAVDETIFCKYCDFITDNLTKLKEHNKLLCKPKCSSCNRLFSAKSNLFKHKKKCQVGSVTDNIEKDNTNNKGKDKGKGKEEDLFVQFIKDNKELKNILVEQNNKLLQQNEEQNKLIAKLTQRQAITNNNTTNHFNLNVFLNDTCKDALNITDFVKSLKIQVSDLEETGKLGYVDGITRIILNGLKDVDVNKRPLHCTDLKRETVYIKNDNIWEKENPDKSHLKNAVEHISHLNLQQLRPWQEMNPLYKDITTKENDMFIHLSTQAIGSCSQTEGDKNVEKILKNVLKEVVLDKTTK